MDFGKKSSRYDKPTSKGISVHYEDTFGKAAKAAKQARRARERDALLRHRKLESKGWIEQDNKHFILQQMPTDRASFEITTCRHPYCPAPDRISQPSSYRVSIEDDANFVRGSQWRHQIPLKPTYPWSRALKYGMYACEKRGEGENVKAWWCLACLENVWLELDGFIKRPDEVERPDRLDMEQLSTIYPESRARGTNNPLFHLSSPQEYGVAKWKATIHHKWWEEGTQMGEEAVYGSEEGTVYEDAATRDMKGVDEVKGEVVEITAHQVRGKRLSEVLRLVDENVALKRQQAADAAAPPPTRQRLKLTVKRKANNDEAGAEAAAPAPKQQRLKLNPPKKRGDGMR